MIACARTWAPILIRCSDGANHRCARPVDHHDHCQCACGIRRPRNQTQHPRLMPGDVDAMVAELHNDLDEIAGGTG